MPRSDPACPTVRIWLLGTPRWSVAGQLPHELNRKDAALFALLALQGETARDRVAAWLWPDVPQANARLNLRQRLHKLRRLSDHELVRAATSIELLSDVWVDVRQAELADDAGALLGSHDYGDLGALDDWVQAERQHVHGRRVSQLAGQAAQLEARGELARAIELVQRIVVQAPWHEHSWRRLMRLHYLRGDRAAALASFKRFERGVCAEQGRPPTGETLELLRTIELSEARPAVGAPLPASLVRPPLQIGREEAMRAAAAAWEQGRAVLVLGEGGMGKTRLLTEMVNGRGGAPGGVLWARARPGDAAAPYATATALLRQALELFAPALAAATRLELSRLLPELGDAPASPARQALLWHAVEQALALCQEQGLSTLVVDDVHLADAATLELLRWLLASAPLVSLRLAFAARPDEPSSAAGTLREWMGESTRVEPVHLRPLAPSQVQALVESLHLSALQGPAASLAAALHRHAGGHPFYTLETLKSLVLGDALPEAATGTLPMPASVGALIERRLRHLAPSAQELLNLAAVADGELPHDVAAAALGHDGAALHEAWLELERSHVVQGGAIAHDLVREAVLARLPSAVLPELHARLAQALASRAGVGVAAARLGHHWSKAGRWAEAAVALRDASQAARRAGRLLERLSLLQQLAQACERCGDRAGAFAARCDGVATTLVLHGDAAVLQALTELDGQAQTADEVARLDVLRAESLLNLSRAAEALHAAARACANATPGSAWAADAATLHGQALALNGRAAEGVAQLEQAVATALAHGDASRELTAMAALANAYTGADRRGDAYRAQQRTVQLARGMADSTELAVHTANLATLAYMTGHNEQAWRCACEAGERLRAMGAGGGQAHYNTVIQARSGVVLGHLKEAVELLQGLLQAQAADAVPGGGAGAAAVAPTIATMARIALASVRFCLGQPDVAMATLPEPGDNVHPLARAGLLLAWARIAGAAGHDTTRYEQGLLALDAAQPGLLDDPVLLYDFSRHLPPALALRRLAKARKRLRASGCEGLERCIALGELRCRLALGGAGLAATTRLARQLARQLPQGVHAAPYPPEMWWLVANGLRDAEPATAEACRQRALTWIAQASLPDASEPARRRFEQGNPLNRMVLQSLPITG